MFGKPTNLALKIALGVAIGGLGLSACVEDPEPARTALPYATGVEHFSPGPGAGWGAEHFPELVLGPPQGALNSAAAAGRDEVLSLGAGGEIVLSFEGLIMDGPGADFVVFENPFWIRNDPTQVWYELGEVAVSQDGESWHTFPCAAGGGEQPGQWPGCAGWSPTRVYDAEAMLPLDPAQTGGDAFDLAELGLEWARYVRVRDLLDDGNSTLDNVGFDLDAVGVVHLEAPPSEEK